MTSHFGGYRSFVKKNTRNWENLRAGGSQVWPKSTLSMDIFEMGLT